MKKNVMKNLIFEIYKDNIIIDVVHGILSREEHCSEEQLIMALQKQSDLSYREALNYVETAKVRMQIESGVFK
jgi:Tfp pilus assembly PilM family ATPase